MISYDRDFTLFQNYKMAFDFIERKNRNSVASYMNRFSHEALDFLVKILEVDQSKRMNW